MIKLNYIQEFVVLAETLNFSKTAELTFITQPALSRHIAALERDMGGALFVRTTRAVALTPAGEAAYVLFNNILQNYQAAKDQVAFLSSDKLGMLKICSPYYWSVDYTEPLTEAFLEQRPRCDVHITSLHPPDGLQAVIHGRVDVMISDTLIALDGDENICRHPFSSGQLAVAMRLDHPLAERTSLTLRELSGNDFILAGDTTAAVPGSGASTLHENINHTMLQLLLDHGVRPRNILYTQQIDTMGITLHQSGGVGIVPYAMRYLGRANLKVIPLVDEDCRIPVCLYYRSDNRNPLLEAFVEYTKVWEGEREPHA